MESKVALIERMLSRKLDRFMALTSRLPLRSRLPVAIFASFLLLISLYVVQAKQQAARIAAAPRLTADDLTAAYQKHPDSAHRQFDHQFIVLTGYVTGLDEGLIGDGLFTWQATMGKSSASLEASMTLTQCPSSKRSCRWATTLGARIVRVPLVNRVPWRVFARVWITMA